MTGFGKDNDRQTIELIKRRLTPGLQAIEDGQGLEQFTAAGRTLARKFEMRLFQEAMAELLESGDFPAAREHFIRDGIAKAQEQFPNELQDAGLDVIAEQIENAGLKVWQHLRRSDEGFMLSRAGRAAIAATGYPGMEHFPADAPESLDDVGIGRSPFWHDLTEFSTVNGEETMNTYGFVSVAISATLFGIGDPKKGREILETLVMKASPTVAFDKLMARARYDDRALLKLANYAVAGFDSAVAASRD